MSTKSDWVIGLAKDLKSPGMDLLECGTLTSLLDPANTGPAFASGLKIRVAEYHDIEPPMLIYDAIGGTLALVHNVNRGSGTLESDIRAAIDNAVSIRQIALEIAYRTAREAETKRTVVALQVEIVLVAEGEAGQDPVPGILSRLARDTGYLRLVGLSVLEAADCGSKSTSALRRAFPWLLRSTQAWFKDLGGTPASETWRAADQPFSLQLDDYRLRGQRRLTCEGTTKLHLLHGHNGSGKSTFTEALEFLTTGRIERVDDSGAGNYFEAVRHRRHYSPVEQNSVLPTVSFFSGDSVSPKIKVWVTPDNEVHGHTPQPITFQAKSFRLDSIFMERLARSTPESRALLFLDAFSPGGSSAYARIEQDRKSLRDSVNALSLEARKNAPLEDDKLVDWVAQEYAGENGITTSLTAALLPWLPDETNLLSRIYPSISSAVSGLSDAKTAAALEAAVTLLDSAFIALLTNLPNAWKALQTTLQVFTEFRNWVATGQAKRGMSFETDLDRWLELRALVDLHAKYLDVVSTLADAEKLGWAPSPDDAGLLPRGPVAEDLISRLQARKLNLALELNEARGRVQAWQQQPDTPAVQPGTGSPPPGKMRAWLTDAERVALNEAAQWIQVVNPISEPLGDCFARALEQDVTVTFGSSWVGSPPGLESAIGEIQSLLAVLDKATVPETGAGQASDRLAGLKTIVARASALKQQTSAAASNLFRNLANNDDTEQQRLVAAFNELLALMTPARWNYRDLKLQAVATGKTSLGIQTEDGGRADLLLNTAELNAWTLAMFLLLACRLPNPMRVLVLDDPLQNMDELSVVTLARGLGRLMRIFPEGWLILGLFHGEQNVEMIRVETECHVYHLPWLQSRMASADELKKLDALSTAPATRQILDSSWFADQPLAATA